MKPPTSVQLSIADMHHIPRRLAHTINVEKAAEYLKYCCKPECRLEEWMDREYHRQEFLRKAEWM